jgi:hypothetical protein
LSSSEELFSVTVTWNWRGSIKTAKNDSSVITIQLPPDNSPVSTPVTRGSPAIALASAPGPS